MSIRPIYQLNTPHCTPENPGTCGGADCAICCIIMAIDFATDGKIRPTQKQVRARIGVPSTGGLSLKQVEKGILGFEERFVNNGFKTPNVTVHDNGEWADFAEISEHEWRNYCGIVFWNNKDWNHWCKNKGKKSWSGDLEFNGTHAILTRNLTRGKNETTIKVFNSLWDGRRDMPSNTRVITGPRRVPINPFRNAVYGRAGLAKIDWVQVEKARRILPAPIPPPDPCADATEPSGQPGRSSEGAV